jgi:hypothetical protein
MNSLFTPSITKPSVSFTWSVWLLLPLAYKAAYSSVLHQWHNIKYLRQQYNKWSISEGQCTGEGGRIYRHPFKKILESNFTSSKTFLSPFWVRAEHSTYLTARSSLASFSPISRLSGFCLFFAEHRGNNNQLCHDACSWSLIWIRKGYDTSHQSCGCGIFILTRTFPSRIPDPVRDTEFTKNS